MNGYLPNILFRLTPHASRLTPHASRLTPHASRLTPHASRLTPQLDKCYDAPQLIMQPSPFVMGGIEVKW
ncbi:hypothetical protein GCM10009022_48950 [Vreelandella titanicae]